MVATMAPICSLLCPSEEIAPALLRVSSPRSLIPARVAVSTVNPSWAVTVATLELSAARWQLRAMSVAVAAISSAAVATPTVWAAAASAAPEMEPAVTFRRSAPPESRCAEAEISRMMVRMLAMNWFSLPASSPISSLRLPTSMVRVRSPSPSASSATRSHRRPSGARSLLSTSTTTRRPATRKAAPMTARATNWRRTGAAISSRSAVTQRYHPVEGTRAYDIIFCFPW